MPLYDMQCTACGYVFEAFQQMEPEQLSVCPKCGKIAGHRAILASPAAHDTYDPSHPRKHRGRGSR